MLDIELGAGSLLKGVSMSTKREGGSQGLPRPLLPDLLLSQHMTVCVARPWATLQGHPDVPSLSSRNSQKTLAEDKEEKKPTVSMKTL